MGSDKSENPRGLYYKNWGGMRKVADLAEKPAGVNLSAAIRLVGEKMFELASEHEETLAGQNVRVFKPKEVLEEIQRFSAGEAPEEHLLRAVEGSIIAPYADLCGKLRELLDQIEALCADDARKAYAEDVAKKSDDSVEAMLAAFDSETRGFLAAWESWRKRRDHARSLRDDANECAAKAGGLIAERETVLKTLSELVRTTLTEADTESGPLAYSDGRARRRSDIEKAIAECDRLGQRIAFERQRHGANADLFFSTERAIRDALPALLRDHSRLEIMKRLFLAGNVDAEAMCGIAIPGVSDLVCESEEPPSDFPEVSDESRAMQRAETARQKVLDLVEKAKSEPPVTASVSPADLAVASFAVFCRRTGRGKPHPQSGRTVRVAWRSIVFPSGCAFGNTEDAFRTGIKDAVSRGDLRTFFPGLRRRDEPCVQPTEQGFLKAEEIMKRLPQWFRERIERCDERLRAEQQEFRMKRLGLKK